MRIAWFSPYNHDGVTRYSMHAINALRIKCEVDLFAEGEIAGIKTNIFTNIQNLEEVLAKYECIIYNLGSDAEKFSSIYYVMIKHEGIVILHDIRMFEFYRKLIGEAGIYNLITQYYSAQEAVELNRLITDAGSFHAIDMENYNLLKPLLKNATGVFVHSKENLHAVKENYEKYSAEIPFLNMYDDIAKTSSSPYKNGKFNMLSVGEVRADKLILSIINAFENSSFLRENVCCTIVGQTKDLIYLNKIISKLNKLGDCIKVMGYVEKDLLNAYYTHADVVCNLRFPRFEGALATLQEQMFLGKCVIVGEEQSKDIPKDCVIKLNLKYMQRDLETQLKTLIKDKTLLQSIGDRAKSFAHQKYNNESYADALLENIEKCKLPNLFVKGLHQTIFAIKEETEGLGFNKLQDISFNITDIIAEELENLYYSKKETYKEY